MSVRSAHVGLIVSLVLGACAPTTDGADVDSQGSAAALGVLQVEREAGSALSDRAVLGAAFARYRGLDETDVARLLGVGALRTGDACSFAQSDLDGLESPDAEVELLDIGALDIRLGTEHARLVARTFPELARVAAGFFYAGEASLGVPTPEVDEYVFRTDGSDDVAPIEVSVVAPADLEDVRVDGHSVNADQTLDRSAPLSLTWTRGDDRDLVEIELRTASGTLSCTTPDDGAFRIDAQTLSQVSSAPDASLVVRRVRIQSFDAPGVDEAVARLSSVRNFDVRVR